MSEMVERVARAVAASEGGRITGPGQCRATREFGWKGEIALQQYADAHWREYITAAHAAIEAMREPTRAMIDAAEWAGIIGDYGQAQRGYFESEWACAIDKALED